MRPLDGITVVTLEHAVAAPFATRQLADLGARVIKIERIGSGDFARSYDARVEGMASYFVWINRSKESVALDVKNPASKKVLRQLVEKADVFVQNLGPGASARLGLSIAELRSDCPSLVVCDVSGYGQNGPYRDKKAYDILIQAEAGLLSVTGTSDQPARAGISAADISAGMYAYSSILSALLLRHKTGSGSHIDISMLEALGEWMSYPLYYTYNGGSPPPRAAASHPTIYPYGPLKTSDGKTVVIGVQNEREWASFCAVVLELPNLSEDPRFNSNVARNSNRDVLKGIVENAFLAMPIEEAILRLDRAGLGNARMNGMQDVWTHPQLAARDRWRNVGSPVGDIPALLPPAIVDTFSYRMDPIPDVGEHTEAVLLELGYSDAEIRNLRKLGAIG